MTDVNRPVILWVRRDLRLDDNVALNAAINSGRPVIPLFIRDKFFDQLGAAAKWRYGLGVDHFAKSLSVRGSGLVLRSGEVLDVLRDVIAETGATQVHWSRSYDPQTITRDSNVKASLIAQGVVAKSHQGFLLVEPWAVQTRAGRPFQVYTPFWRSVSSTEIRMPFDEPQTLNPPDTFPASEDLASWRFEAGMNRSARHVLPHLKIGEDAAKGKLECFLAERIQSYRDRRDFPAAAATSGLSDNLTCGEISPARIWHRAIFRTQVSGQYPDQFLKELVWREFAWHLYWHAPDLPRTSWNRKWQGFQWRNDPADFARWKQARTGVELVDAGLRELHLTGKMHNRVRMIVASYLTKHLLIDWRLGAKFFADHLVDFDPASNAMGWQWIAGSGPDAAPYFRIFNPDRQADTFDKDRAYRDRYLMNGPELDDFYRVIPVSWNQSPQMPPANPDPLSQGRARALEAYKIAFPKSQ